MTWTLPGWTSKLGSIVAVAAALALAGWLYSRMVIAQHDLDRATANAERLLAQHVADSTARMAALASADSARREARADSAAADTARRVAAAAKALAHAAVVRADVASARADSIEAGTLTVDSAGQVTTYRDAWLAQREATGKLLAVQTADKLHISSLEGENAHLRFAVDTLRSSLVGAQQRITDLTAGLDTLHAASRCTIVLGIGCPSRGAMFVGGGILGAVLHAVL